MAASLCAACGSGDAEVERRSMEEMMVVAWRFAGLVVDRVTLMSRPLNLVWFDARAAFASSCQNISNYLMESRNVLRVSYLG